MSKQASDFDRPRWRRPTAHGWCGTGRGETAPWRSQALPPAPARHTGKLQSVSATIAGAMKPSAWATRALRSNLRSNSELVGNLPCFRCANPTPAILAVCSLGYRGNRRGKLLMVKGVSRVRTSVISASTTPSGSPALEITHLAPVRIGGRPLIAPPVWLPLGRKGPQPVLSGCVGNLWPSPG